MPRSGSTLLFDLMNTHPKLLSWGDEAYPPWAAVDPEVGSGALGDNFRPESLDANAGERAAAVMHGGVVAHEQPGLLIRRGLRRYRLLEKTPANVVRVAALQQMFPDARFIHLVRDAPDNIASLLEGRDRGLAIRDWPKRNGMEWHFLMPAGWQEHLSDSPAAQFAWQWATGNQAAFDDLEGSDFARVRYEDLVADPAGVVEDLLTFAALPMTDAVARACADMALSKHTLSTPGQDKWRDRAAEIEPVLGEFEELRRMLGYRY